MSCHVIGVLLKPATQKHVETRMFCISQCYNVTLLRILCLWNDWVGRYTLLALNL